MQLLACYVMVRTIPLALVGLRAVSRRFHGLLGRSGSNELAQQSLGLDRGGRTIDLQAPCDMKGCVTPETHHLGKVRSA